MFERYNQPARRSLFFARYETSTFGGLAIETEHLLLGILKTRDPLITHLLGRTHEIRQLIEALIAPAPQIDTSVEIPFSKGTKQVLQYTAEEADRLLHRHIGCEHLLLGLLRHEQGLAWDVLNARGLALASVRDALVLHVSASSPPPPEIAGMLAAMSSAMSSPSVERTQRSADMYVLTALDGPSPGRRATTEDDAAGSGASFSTVDFSTVAQDRPQSQIHSIGPISMSGATLSQFTNLLEDFLGRPVFDDTGLAGTWDIELEGQYDNPEALIAALRDQLGLELAGSL